MMDVIDRLQKHVDTVSPGMPACFTDACQAGDGIWQGDLGLEIVDSIPVGYTKLDAPSETDRQLVPGQTAGSRHCLDSLDGVVIWRPADWQPESLSLSGPCLVLTRDREVLHPVHGTVTLLGGTIILCRYQREWDKEQMIARRSED